MGFYSNFSDYFMSLLVTGVVIAFVAAKLFRTIDDDGSIKKTASERVKIWISRWID